MAKKVLYIRHAKSSWDNPLLKDIERPLNETGRKAAQNMANYLKMDIKDQKLLMVSSPAIRAMETARYFALALDYSPEQIVLAPDLYYGVSDDYINTLKTIDEIFSLVLVFGHNPTISQVVSSFKIPFTGHMATCAVVMANLLGDHWFEISPSNLVIEKSFFPKLLFNE